MGPILSSLAPLTTGCCLQHQAELAGLENIRSHEFGDRERRSFQVFRFWWRNRQLQVDV